MSSLKVDVLTDYERRELDLWIAKHIEQFDVRDTAYVPADSMCRLTDTAWKEFKKLHAGFVPGCKGPYPIAHYSFNPVIALDTFQSTEYSEGWAFLRENEKWQGINDGLSIDATKSLALAMMMALRHEYEFQNKKEEPHE